MRRVLAAVLSVVALLGFLVVDASAQAPTSKVTITGLMDYVSTYTKNHSAVDNNFSRAGDTEWYSRTRLRPDITAEVGTTKFVLGIEIDYTWGTTTGAGAVGSGVRGTTAGTPLNTDVVGILELKWGYTEFDLPGLPFATRVRLGAQPWGSTVTYKPGVHATGDFAGAVATMTFAPQFKLILGYAQIEEEGTGPSDGFGRGEDFAFTMSAEVTPVKGIDIKPFYTYFRADGATSGASRQARGGLGNVQSGNGAVLGVGGAVAAGTFPLASVENRHTLGVDARLALGPISIFPTFLVQFGEREFMGTNNRKGSQDRRAWLGDVRAAFTAGPLLLEAGASYTSGNRANDDIRNPSTDIRYVESISQDGGYWGTWCELWCLDIDYNTGLAISQVSNMGYDKYGRAVLAGKATYAVTPTFSLRSMFNAQWTAHSVDWQSARAAGSFNLTPGDFRGDTSFLGVEVDLGFRWTMAPGLDLDVIGAYLFAGGGLVAQSATSGNGVVREDINPKDIMSLGARVRYSF